MEALPNTDAIRGSFAFHRAARTSADFKALNADVTIRLREPGGRALADRIALKVNTGKSFIGVKPLFDGSVAEGAPAAFEIIGIGPDGKQAAISGLKWEFQRVESQFQWYSPRRPLDL